MDDFEKFQKVLNGPDRYIRIITTEESYALEIVRESAIFLKRNVHIWTAASGIRDGLLSDSPIEVDTEDPAAALCHFAQAPEGTICVMLDPCEHFNKITTRLFRDIKRDLRKNNITLVLIDHSENLPEIVKAASFNFELSLPDKPELEILVRDTLRDIHKKNPIEIGITRRGMDIIVRNLQGLTRSQAKEIIAKTVEDDQRFDDDDINCVLSNKRRLMENTGYLEYVQTPLTLDEIGGMKNLKKWLAKRSKIFSKEAKEFGLESPKGVLMLGVQGAGKSLCAKAIATAWQQPLLKLDVGALYNSYIGETEKNLRNAFKQVGMMAPVVLWIDEIEKAFASAGSQSNDGGLSKRMFGTLLTWMQDHTEPVFVVATANDISALPPELLRKGRFDEIFFVDLPDEKVREKILEIHLRKRKRNAETFDLSQLAKACDGFSGAEIEQSIVDAMYNAFAQQKELETDHIVESLSQTVPLSVTMAEKVDQLRAWADERCTPAD